MKCTDILIRNGKCIFLKLELDLSFAGLRNDCMRDILIDTDGLKKVVNSKTHNDCTNYIYVPL